MADGYSVKVNRRDGSIEVTGDDKEWVDEKLKELAAVWSEPLVTSRSASNQAPKSPAKKRSSTASTSGETENGRTRGRKSGSRGRAGRDEELAAKLSADIRVELAKYVSARQVAFDKKQPHQAAIIATFLQDELGVTSLNEHGLYTVYDMMGWRTPGRPRAVLDNAREREGFFSVKGGEYALTHKGENYGRMDSVTPDSE